MKHKSFSLERRTIRSGNSFDLKMFPSISAHDEQPNEASETHTVEGNDETITKSSPALLVHKVKASLEPLHAQFSTLTHVMN